MQHASNKLMRKHNTSSKLRRPTMLHASNKLMKKHNTSSKRHKGTQHLKSPALDKQNGQSNNSSSFGTKSCPKAAWTHITRKLKQSSIVHAFNKHKWKHGVSNERSNDKRNGRSININNKLLFAPNNKIGSGSELHMRSIQLGWRDTHRQDFRYSFQ
jgi:hypothetical protein